jgi:hypothetical protein
MAAHAVRLVSGISQRNAVIISSRVMSSPVDCGQKANAKSGEGVERMNGE